MVEVFFRREVYLVLCSGSFLFLLSLLSLSFILVIRMFPLNIFCCHSTDFIMASRCVLCKISVKKEINFYYCFAYHTNKNKDIHTNLQYLLILIWCYLVKIFYKNLIQVKNEKTEWLFNGKCLVDSFVSLLYWLYQFQSSLCYVTVHNFYTI